MYKLIYELIDKLTYELIYKLNGNLLLHSSTSPSLTVTNYYSPLREQGTKKQFLSKKVIFNFGTPPLFCWTLYVLTLVFV